MYDPSQNEVIQVLVEELEKDGGAAAPHDVIVKMGQRFGLSIDENNITTDASNKLFRHKVYCAASVARTKRGLLEPTSKSGRGRWMLKSAYKQQMGKSSVDQDHIPPPVIEVEKPITKDQEPKIVPLSDVPFMPKARPSNRLTSDLSIDIWVVLAVGLIATLLVIAGVFSSAFAAGDLLLGYPAWDWVRLGATAYLACLIILLHSIARRRAGNDSSSLLIIWGARFVAVLATMFVVLGLMSILIDSEFLGYPGESGLKLGAMAYLICAVILVYIIVPKDNLDYGRSLWRNEMWAAMGVGVLSSLLVALGVLEVILGSSEVVLEYTALTWVKIGALGYLVCIIVLLHSIVRQDEESSTGSIVILLARVVFVLATVVASVGIIGGLVVTDVLDYPVLDWLELGAVGYFVSIALLLYSVAQRYVDISLKGLSIWIARGFGALATVLVLVGLAGWMTSDAGSFLGYDSWGWIHLGVVVYLIFAIVSVYGMTARKS